MNALNNPQNLVISSFFQSPQELFNIKIGRSSNELVTCDNLHISVKFSVEFVNPKQTEYPIDSRALSNIQEGRLNSVMSLSANFSPASPSLSVNWRDSE